MSPFKSSFWKEFNKFRKSCWQRGVMNNEQEWRQHALNLTHTFPYTVRSLSFLLCLPIYIPTRLHVSACPGILYSLRSIVLYFFYILPFLCIIVFCAVFEIVFIVNGIRHYNFKLCKRILLIWNLKFNGVKAEATTSYALPPTVYSKIKGFRRSFFA